MKALINFSVKHPVSVLMCSILLLLLGFISVSKIPESFYPELSENEILVTTRHENYSAEEIRKQITIPLEENLSSLKNLETMKSVSKNDVSFITLIFKHETDMKIMNVEVKELLENFYSSLPYDTEKPEVKIKNQFENPVLTVAVFPEQGNLPDAYDFAENQLKTFFSSCSQCGKIEILETHEEELHMIPDKKMMDHYNISFYDLKNAVEKSNAYYSSGTVFQNENEYVISTDGNIKTIEELKNIPVICKSGLLLKLKDVSKFEKTENEPNEFSFYNGKKCIPMNVYLRKNQNPLMLSKNIRKEIKKFQNQYEGLYSFEIIHDASESLSMSLLVLLLSILSGLLISFTILFLYYRSFKISLSVSLVIPFSILFIVSILYLFKKSINLFSLCGITICLGMIVDSSIVSIQSVISEIKSNRKKTLEENIINGISKVTKSNTGSTITTVSVFLPVVLSKSLISELFTDLSIAIISGLLFSVLYSFSFLPALGILFIKSGFTSSKGAKIERLEKIFDSSLRFISRKKINSGIIKLLLLIIFFLSIFFIKKEILKDLYTNEQGFNLQYPENLSKGKTLECAKDFSNVLLKTGMFKSVFFSNSFIIEDDPFSGNNQVQFNVVFKNKKNLDFLKEMLEKENIPFTYEKLFNDNNPFQFTSENAYLLQCRNPETLRRVIEENKIILSPFVLSTEHAFIPFKDRSSFLHLSEEELSDEILTLLKPLSLTSLNIEGKQTQVKIIPEKIPLPEEILNCTILSENGPVALSSLGRIQKRNMEKVLYRYDRLDAKYSSLKPDFPSSSKVKITDIRKTKILSILFEIALLIIPSIIILYCVTGINFESFTYPFIIFQSILPSFSGALFLLFITGQSLNINSILSLIVLTGLSVNVPIILTESYDELKIKSQKNIIDSTRKKLPVIFITVMTSMLSLLPFSFDPFNINSQVSLSIGIIGGLLFSTFHVILFFPFSYYVKFGAKNA